MEFQNQKSQRLGHVDLSRKGSVDEPIAGLVTFINSLPNYFTTSSCSGRIIVFESADNDKDTSLEKSEPTYPKVGAGKKGCKWLYVSHSKVNPQEQVESLDKVNSSSGNAVFKFEAMVMHIQCQALEHAQKMHQAAVAAGFRNSGISIGGKRKLILGVRSTHGLEVPLTKNGAMLVTSEYYQYLVECANEKMEENFTRINRFFENIKLLKESSSNGLSDKKLKRPKAEKGIVSKHGGAKQSSSNADTAKSSVATPCIDDERDELSLFMFDDT